jgi:TfoX/Sxy family transcriptional regulator of competence genes
MCAGAFDDCDGGHHLPTTANATAEELYQVVAARYAGKVEASPSKGFGSNALKVNGKIFASLSKGRLLLKLPEARVDALVKSKKAVRFSTGVGRVKKEWLTVAPGTKREWLALAEEARAYVMAQAS